MLHGGWLLAVEDVHEDTGCIAGGGGASVVAGVGGQRARDEQATGAGLLFRDHADPPALRVVDDVPTAVPVDEARWFRRLQHDARQVNVTTALYVQFRVSDYLRLGY